MKAIIITGVLVATAVLVGCSRQSRIVVGGLYACKSDKGTYVVSKVLAVDDTAVHIRSYTNQFQHLPENLNTPELSIGKPTYPGWAACRPIAKEWWIKYATFLKKEPVREEELDAYKSNLRRGLCE